MQIKDNFDLFFGMISASYLTMIKANYFLKLGLFAFFSISNISILAEARPPRSTEASACTECLNTRVAKTIQDAKISMDNITQDISNAAQCVANKITAAAKKVIEREFDGRTRGKGECAKAVRKFLNASGVWNGDGLGDGKDFAKSLSTRIGFKNIIEPGMTPESAPDGAILVYGTPAKGARGCKGLGNQYGHVEVKQDDDTYLYDGLVSFHIQEAFGAHCRPLIGVMVMGEDCKSCDQSVKNKCGV